MSRHIYHRHASGMVNPLGFVHAIASYFTSHPLLFLGQWLFIAFIVAVLAGRIRRLPLFPLSGQRLCRESHRWMIWLATRCRLQRRLGLSPATVAASRPVIISFWKRSITPLQVIPLRMAPLVFTSTVISLIFWRIGWPGRYRGTNSLDSRSIHTALLRLNNNGRAYLLMTGISAGFSSVFGTPLAGIIRAGVRWRSVGWTQAILPCLSGAIVADGTRIDVGASVPTLSGHLHSALSARHCLAVILADAALARARLFADTPHLLSSPMKIATHAPLRPFIGGLDCDGSRLLHGERSISG